MCYNYLFTVFTPTYNRAHTLHRVYESLVLQTFRDFEWLVVDDGSTDGTRAVISEWRRSADFPIRYLFQPNQGKHVAHNCAVSEARGALFLVLDSDDSCVPQALQTFKFYWESIPSELRGRFSAVNVPCLDERGQLVGRTFSDHVTDSDYLSSQYRWRLRGERWEFQRTDVLRQFPFPVPPMRLSYIPEGTVWSRIGRNYKTRYVNEPLRVYYETEGNVSTSGSRSQKQYLRMFYCQVMLNEQFDYFRYAPLEFLRAAVHYLRWSLHRHESMARSVGSLQNLGAKLICLLMLPAALIVYRDDIESDSAGTRARVVRAVKDFLRVRLRGAVRSPKRSRFRRSSN